MIKLLILLALVLAGCGGHNNSPPPYIPPPYVPPPAPPPVLFTGGSINGPWIVTQASAPGSPMGAFPQCPSASTCWVSYVESMLSATFNGAQTYTLTYTITGNNPTFVHDSPNNTPNGDSTVRLLLEGSGYRLFSQVTQPLALGGGSIASSLVPASWIMVDPAGNTITDPTIFANVISHVSSVDFCFGGGFFACHGVAVSSGDAGFQVNSASIQ